MIKKILFSAFGLATGLSALAQLPASQLPANKNVVLEGLTGKDCQFCPDGHKIGNEIKTNNPGRVILLNIHTGIYASGTPNYNSSWGDYIGGLYSVSTYPTGAINRSSFGSTNVMQSRGSWAANSANILGQTSPINVAADAAINIKTRELTVDLEAYYTANGPGSSNNIHVVILQNNIAGPQTGGISYNPSAMLPNGDYNHTHMVRHALTPTTGDKISTVSAGTSFTKTYNYSIPTSYNSIPVKMADLEIVIYVSEGTSDGKIITGDYAAIEFVLPAGSISLDAAASSAHTPPTTPCTVSFTPKATFTNNSTSAAIDTFEISYTLNGGAPVDTAFNGTQNVIAGGTYTHTFPVINLSPGVNTISYSVSNGSSVQRIDLNAKNNSTDNYKINYIPNTPIGNSYTWDFQNSSSLTEDWNNVINTKNVNHFVIDKSTYLGIGNDLGGYAASTKSFLHRLYLVAENNENVFITYKFDLSSTANPGLTFDYAYGQLASGSNDGLEVFATTDCGGTWTSVFNKSGNSFTTGPISSNLFYPTSSQWETETVNLAAFNKTDVMLKFVVKAGNAGNSFYLDNIFVGNAPVTGINSLETQNSLSIFPNPTTNAATISFELTKASVVKMEVVNAIGAVVLKGIAETMRSGVQNIDFDGSDLSNGIYFINLIIDDKIITKKVSLVK